jgi:hypothetical protein
VKYSGDTPAKKIARYAIWLRVKELLGPRFQTGTHVVLLSSEAGDVSTLLGLGVHPHHIVGVDIDVHAIAASRHKFPEIRCLKEDVAAAVRQLKEEGQSPASVYLDFCGSMKDTTVGKAIEVTGYMDAGSVLALGVKMGREMGDWAEDVNTAKAMGSTSVDSRAFYLRADLMTRYLFTKSNGQRLRAEPLDYYRYNSTRVTGEHSAMLVCISRLSAKPELKSKPLESAVKNARRVEHHSIIADYQSIGPLASRLAEQGEDAHLLLNIQKESIPPFKAHRTRGTYDSARPRVVRNKRPS